MANGSGFCYNHYIWHHAINLKMGIPNTQQFPTFYFRYLLLRSSYIREHLGGSVGWASDFSSGHDLTVCGFEPCIRHCADHLHRAWSLLQILCLLLSLPLPHSHFVSLCFSKINKCKKKKKKEIPYDNKLRWHSKNDAIDNKMVACELRIYRCWKSETVAYTK